MANIKQIIPCEPGWEGIYVREDATYDSPVKSASAPLVGWALIDDENGDSAVHGLVSIGAAVTPSFDLGPRWLGAARGGDWALRHENHWDSLAVAFMEEYGEPGAAEEGDNPEEGQAEAPAGEATQEGEPPPEAKAG